MVNKEIKELLYKLAPSGFIVSLDLETTGVDSSKDKIIEIQNHHLIHLIKVTVKKEWVKIKKICKRK